MVPVGDVGFHPKRKRAHFQQIFGVAYPWIEAAAGAATHTRLRPLLLAW